MKNNEIIKCLKSNRKVSAYELVSTVKDTKELYYVLDHLEISRAVNVETKVINVYVNNDETTGSSTVTVTVSDDEKSLNRKIADAVKKAASTQNRYYPLTQKTENIMDKDEFRFNLNDAVSDIADAVLKADVYENGWINSTEIFVTKTKSEFVNSNGVHHVTYGFKVEIEVIPTWTNGKEEFELYKFYQSGKIDLKEITREVDEILNLAKARSEAKKLSSVRIPKNVPVLVKNDMLTTLTDGLIANLSYQNAFYKQSHYKIGDTVSNNKFSLTLKPSIKGAVASRKFDNHGVVLKNKTIIKDGIVVNNYGDIRFGHYLGVKNITGSLPVEELKAEGIDYMSQKHIIIENFSSPQLEMASGYWGGEVRLARYFDGKKYIPLTGFAISGNIYEDIKNIEFSKEKTILKDYKGPKYFIFKGIDIH